MVYGMLLRLPLFEVGSSIRKRYQDQAQVCPLPFPFIKR